MKTFASKCLVSVVLLSSLTNCFSAGPKNTAVYSPRTSLPVTIDGPSVAWQIRINTPTSSDFLDSTRIAVRKSDNTLQVFEGARWADSVPDLLQNNLTQVFNGSGKIIAVSGLDSNTASDTLLLLDIEQFEAVYADKDHSAAAVISVQAKIQSLKTNRVIASKHFFISIPAGNTKIPKVMAAFGAALDQISQEIAAWVLTADAAAKK